MICYQIFYYIYFTANTKTEEKQTRCLAVTGMILAISCGSTCQGVIFMIHICRHVLFSYGFLLFVFILIRTGISLPTFTIAERVLIHLDPDSTRATVSWASKTFSTAVFFYFEQYKLGIFPSIANEGYC